ncbi:PQQ-binding-like beta-propeller repeat protein [Streptomyces sp. NBRC 109706]|uniref:outer membrane protein assembly factor BamB family protein n=1 Tax=Streptomyces sp. NBRC 109706 TaxID=1550035 RepID=UPI001F362836|nr:PQQ-binding-like beta-propeller repeat protein [Streptomyces sp. NBRC 109706]
MLAVVLVLALAGGAWLYFDSEDGNSGQRPLAVDPATPGGRLWAVNEEGVEDGDKPKGFWVVGDTVVKASDSVFTSYALADGSVGWTLDLAPDHVCVPTTATAEGLIVIGHGESNCGQNITLVDLTTGETGWSRPLEPSETSMGLEIAMAGSSYAVQTGGGWSVHRVEDGEVISAGGAMYDSLNQGLARTDFAQGQEIATGDELCAVDAVAGGEALLRRRTCATVTDAANATLTPPSFQLQRIDPDTGDTVWSLDLPEGRWLSKINSTSPVVVTLRDQEFGGELELAFVDDQGQLTGQVPIEVTGLEEDDTSAYIQEVCRGDNVPYSAVDNCGGMVFHGDLLYASPTTMFGDPIVTALNATTGQVVWSFQAEDFSRVMVLGADEGGVLVHQAGFGRDLGRVVRISPDGQTVEPLFKTDDIYLSGRGYVAVVDGQLVLSPPDYSLEYDVAVYGVEGALPEGWAPEEEGEGSA